MYNYQKEVGYVYTEEGQRTFLKIRDEIQRLFKEAGAFRVDVLMCKIGSCDVFQFLACLDRLVELDEIREVKEDKNTATQHRVYVSR